MPNHLRRTTMLMVGCAAFLLGLGIARLQTGISALVPLVLLSLLVVTFQKKSIVTLLVILLFGLSSGIVRGEQFLPNIQKYDALHQQKVALYVTVDTDATYNDRKQLSFDATRIELTEPYEAKLTGKIKISGFGENAVYKGDRLYVEGKLFRTRGSRQASIGFAEISLIARGDSAIDRLRRNFSAGLSNVLPDPQAPFGLGLLIGQRTTLGQEATTWLSVVGLTHIIAVSGYNLTIIVRFMHRMLSKRSRYQTVAFSLLIIGLFLLMTGFSASIVRASIVCLLSLIAWYYGRRFRPLLLLLLTACITAGWYPPYIWSDIGWYLSFLAFFGVLIMAPLFVARFCRRTPKPVTMAIIESFSAQIMTLPLILYIFNQTSLVALISNTLVVSLVPLAMLFTLISGLAGMINPVILQLLAVPANLLLTYILGVARTLSNIPGAIVVAEISAITMVISYILIGIICVIMWRKSRAKYATITDESLI